ncbi:longitudinals lacking protein-like [Ctenocephalides felis]|uniref:longitudinals lacking protein-like n=1 Tax=Ctenocephalides felis TaxID=7515 RepID=UPI000E6E460A|nr:longitudinals lacking protein-like [Ctenocephalides felis]
MSFKNNLISGYQELYRDEMFTDVTLAADGVIAKCHRAVLAISSNFFKIMLESCTGNNHPIIYLNNISQQNLKNLLEFIYYGETRVEHADLSQFILNAESLQIKGLTGPETGATKQTRSIKKKASQSLENEIESPKMIEAKHDAISAPTTIIRSEPRNTATDPKSSHRHPANATNKPRTDFSSNDSCGLSKS